MVLRFIIWNLGCCANLADALPAIKAQDPHVVAFQELQIGQPMEQQIIDALDGYTYCAGTASQWKGISTGTFIKSGECGETVTMQWDGLTCSSVYVDSQTIWNCHLPWQDEVKDAARSQLKALAGDDVVLGDLNVPQDEQAAMFSNWRTDAWQCERVDCYASGAYGEAAKFKRVHHFGSDHYMLFVRQAMDARLMTPINLYLLER